MDWPVAEPIASERLVLEPLTVAHAASMVGVLAERSLYEYTGGVAPNLEELRSRYAAQSVGRSGDGSCWLNWVLICRVSGDPTGFVQATVTRDGSALVADLAWVVAPSWQGKGIASEATLAMVGWLRSNGVGRFTAHIHPGHQASMNVAQNQALHPTFVESDGETRWES